MQSKNGFIRSPPHTVLKPRNYRSLNDSLLEAMKFCFWLISVRLDKEYFILEVFQNEKIKTNSAGKKIFIHSRKDVLKLSTT